VNRLRTIWSGVSQDLPFALRQLRNNPFSNGIIVLTMALLIGGASVLHASLREERARYAPFPELESMVQVWRVGEQRLALMFAPALFLDYQEEIRSFERLGDVQDEGRMTLTTDY
jgi:hypothetical protein